MATKEPTQKAKLTMRAIENTLSTDVDKDYYLRPKLQKCLNLDDLAEEVAALSTRQEDPEDIARIGRQLMQRMMWFLSAGYSISLPIGYFRPTSQGVFMADELNTAPDRSRMKLGVSYSMSEDMRNVLDEAEVDVTTTLWRGQRTGRAEPRSRHARRRHPHQCRPDLHHQRQEPQSRRLGR